MAGPTERPMSAIEVMPMNFTLRNIILPLSRVGGAPQAGFVEAADSFRSGEDASLSATTAGSRGRSPTAGPCRRCSCPHPGTAGNARYENAALTAPPLATAAFAGCANAVPLPARSSASVVTEYTICQFNTLSRERIDGSRMTQSNIGPSESRDQSRLLGVADRSHGAGAVRHRRGQRPTDRGPYPSITGRCPRRRGLLWSQDPRWTARVRRRLPATRPTLRFLHNQSELSLK